jgi:hypothetical protein
VCVLRLCYFWPLDTISIRLSDSLWVSAKGRQKESESMYRVVFRLGVDGSPSFLTEDSSDPTNWENQVAEFEDVSDAIDFAECAYDTLTELSAYKCDYKSIETHVVEIQGCAGCGGLVFQLPYDDDAWFHVGPNCAHAQNLAHVEVA